jgi:HPt (histidine-containing phosphotransfer) domain-containing protein
MEWPADRRPYIVGMTALALPRDRERCIEAGMDDYVSKPVRVEALQAALSRAAAAASRTRASRPAPPAEATPPVAAREAAPGDALVDTAALEQLRMLGEGQEGDFAAELVGRLWDELPNRLATLASALASENASAVERLAHTLKSSCGTVGAAAMAHVCQQMEHAAAAGDVAAARERLGSLRELAQATEPVHRAALQPQARRSA